MPDIASPIAGQVRILTRLQELLDRRPVILQLLRFAAIGVINTALDFLVLNVVSKTLQVSSGLRLGQVNVIGFLLAVIQSYYWNRAWAFGNQSTEPLKNALRLAAVGGLGATAVVAVLLGSAAAAPAYYYLMILGVFLVFEFVLWKNFGLGGQLSQRGDGPASPMLSFLLVSFVGLLVNSLLLAGISSWLAVGGNADLSKNLAKVAATIGSLIWNFFGYKVFVFKK